MFLLLSALALAGPVEPAPKPATDVRATASIVRGREISSKSWDPARQPAQREIVRQEKDGRQVLIRLTEFE